MSSTTSPIFSGVSSYANDLVQVINRAVGIAALPLKQLQNQLQDLNGQASALTGLDSTFSKLQSAIASLGDGIGAKSYSAGSSDPDRLGVSVSSGALESTYTIDISNVGSYSTSISDSGLPSVLDAGAGSISASRLYHLTVNEHSTDLIPTDGSLTSLAQAINGLSAGVHASIVNLGGSGSPQYRLVIRSTSLAADTIQLNDGTRDLLATLSAGSPATYTVNGISGTLESDSRTITLAPGVTANLLQTTVSGQPVTVTVSRDLSSAASGLSAFVDAYNSAADALDHQVGKDAGMLNGHSIIRELRESLRQLTQYQAGSGSLKSLTQLGLTLDKSGKLLFDSTRFDAASVDAVQAFLSGSGSDGFLKTAATVMSAAEDATSGSIKRAEQLIDKQITTQNTLIDVNTQRINDLTASLQQQMASADALIASLESQKNYITNLFTAMMNYNLNGAGVKSN